MLAPLAEVSARPSSPTCIKQVASTCGCALHVLQPCNTNACHAAHAVLIAGVLMGGRACDPQMAPALSTPPPTPIGVARMQHATPSPAPLKTPRVGEKRGADTPLDFIDERAIRWDRDRRAFPQH